MDGKDSMEIKKIVTDYFHNLKDYDEYKVTMMEERVFPNLKKLNLKFADFVKLFCSKAEERCDEKSENIFLVNVGSSGSHWLAAMINELEGINTIGEVYFPTKLKDRVENLSIPDRQFLVNAVHLGHLPNFNSSNAISKIINTGHFSGRMLKFIRESDPNSKCIILIRDPMDIVISRTFRKDEHKQLIAPNSTRDEYLWKNINMVKNWYKNNLKQSFDFEVRYEDLIQDPESSLTSLCTFLNINFELPQIREIIHQYDKDSNPKNTKLFTGSQKKITIAQRQTIEEELSDLRKILGYI